LDRSQVLYSAARPLGYEPVVVSPGPVSLIVAGHNDVSVEVGTPRSSPSRLLHRVSFTKSFVSKLEYNFHRPAMAANETRPVVDNFLHPGSPRRHPRHIAGISPINPGSRWVLNKPKSL
jgi:hypothetical protein